MLSDEYDSLSQKPKEIVNMSTGDRRCKVNRLIILLLSLGVYVILTAGILTRWSNEGSSVPSAIQKTLDLSIKSVNIESTGDGSDDEEEDYHDEKNDESTQYVCDAQNSPDFPDGVIKRSLHAVIIGAMKGGTQALHKILMSHPRILSSSKIHGEFHFFSHQGLARNLPEDSPIRQSEKNYRMMKKYNNTRIILRQDMRDAFERILSDRGLLNERKNGTNDITNEKNQHKVGIHSAPIYIFSGRSVPARLMCVAPWIKVVAILRNPIERAFSQYNFVFSKKGRGKEGRGKEGKRPSFDSYIANDIRLLKKTRVLEDWKVIGQPEEEFQAWERYIQFAKGKGPIGRGLYAIQLEIWMDEFKKGNKSVEDDLLVLRSEEMKENPKDGYHQAVEFLGLERERAKRRVIEKAHHQTKYIHAGMSNETYKKLYDLYQPYNKRLYKLLGEDWGGVWDDE